MTRFISLRSAAVAAALFLTSFPVAFAWQHSAFGDAADSATAAEATADQPKGSGRVVAVDPDAGRITLEYRPMPRLFLQGGVRIFDVDSSDRAPLSVLGPGDKVRFDVERNGRRYIVSNLEHSN